ncbi:MAG: SDR family NAD(P)-dependent oxidoreductase [Anaerovoracaceae bacterium]|jgi:meso-butanediol dehydrogenase/(S,S)-butanediol dehydrogenase/diacetyl reductase
MPKTAIVTGSGAGIGKAIALRLAKEGYDVTVNARHEETIRKVAEEIERMGRKALVIPGDVSDYRICRMIVDRTANELGGPDVLINNAGTCPVRMIRDVDPEMFDQTMRTNVTSMYACSRYAARYMAKAGGGVIVNAASQASFSQNAGSVEYSASKWAVRGLTREMAAEFAPAHIRVVAYAPGVVWTNMMEGIAEGAKRELGVSKERYIAAGKRRIPLGEFQTPEDVAALVAFLVSDEAAHITGQNIMINGGDVMC